MLCFACVAFELLTLQDEVKLLIRGGCHQRKLLCSAFLHTVASQLWRCACHGGRFASFMALHSHFHEQELMTSSYILLTTPESPYLLCQQNSLLLCLLLEQALGHHDSRHVGT